MRAARARRVSARRGDAKPSAPLTYLSPMAMLYSVIESVPGGPPGALAALTVLVGVVTEVARGHLDQEIPIERLKQLVDVVLREVADMAQRGAPGRPSGDTAEWIERDIQARRRSAS